MPPDFRARAERAVPQAMGYTDHRDSDNQRWCTMNPGERAARVAVVEAALQAVHDEAIEEAWHWKRRAEAIDIKRWRLLPEEHGPDSETWEEYAARLERDYLIVSLGWGSVPNGTQDEAREAMLRMRKLEDASREEAIRALAPSENQEEKKHTTQEKPNDQ